MLLLHQTGSVKIGEIVRYTVTYTPAHDRILPSPAHLFLKIKNTSAIALRAAFVHGPYTLYAAAYPSTFNPNSKFDNPQRYGVPEFEPNLKAGGTFSTRLNVPEDVRESAGTGSKDMTGIKGVSWIIEVSSQVIFSNSAAVHYEILLGRDEKSLSLGFGLSGSAAAPTPGQVSDHQQSHGGKKGRHNAQPKGIYSKAIHLAVEDTASLWNTPKMPEWEDEGKDRGKKETAAKMPDGGEEGEEDVHQHKRQKKIHLVVLTHGLHGNLGADMLFLKESIDATAKQAKIDARARKARGRQRPEEEKPDSEYNEVEDAFDDEEDVIVRGFSGNAVRTERGLKYLGKRLAKYVLQMTYPDQPYRPVTKKNASHSLSHALKPESKPAEEFAGTPAHHDSSTVKEIYKGKKLAYKITSISFISHSLGGLVQTYAVAYIQKHSPKFFDVIEPVNFVAMASPFLGLSNENPLYVKFALDFGLVGRTGQDLGLTWRAPTIARSGWSAMVSGLTDSAHKKADAETTAEAKPLLRILPTGPAHIVFKKFRNRTVYSNVVNDGIVPLRTSCLLFLDWQGLGRVEKARRDNGLVGTMAEWGWAEITGQNSSSPNRRTFSESIADSDGVKAPMKQGHGMEVPQPPDFAVEEDARSVESLEGKPAQKPKPSTVKPDDLTNIKTAATYSKNDTGPLSSILGFFRPSQSSGSQSSKLKQSKIYKRSQTLKINNDDSTTSASDREQSPARILASNGDTEQGDYDHLSEPPKTSFFEAAGDLLKPPLPSVDFLIDPASRQRTIFHDRVYHPEDIPPPPLKKRPTSNLLRRRSTMSPTSPTSGPPPHTDSSLSARDYDDTKHTNPNKASHEIIDGSAMKVEEKIARAYHRDLSWRKVLVRLEPDAHNNMVVRRMFANAYGWPVIKHLCDTHFGDSEAARTRDEEESNVERAKDSLLAPDAMGKETRDSQPNLLRAPQRTGSEAREATDKVSALAESGGISRSGLKREIPSRPTFDRTGTESDAGWSERDWADSELDSDDDEIIPGENKKSAWNWTEAIAGKGPASPKGTDKSILDDFLGKTTSGVTQLDRKGRDKHNGGNTPSVVKPTAIRTPSPDMRVRGGLEDALSVDERSADAPVTSAQLD
ncbi:putative serine esterase-domain-containing protein [Calycina marina]|uniref:Serine esterase-domain-containing protein n=1 Tax=Calycina marina TaxID=1763456 RepID=A0A9P8CEW3_9HELO|nr:putative serine esterase-domain-containing protein [Calycina marina]